MAVLFDSADAFDAAQFTFDGADVGRDIDLTSWPASPKWRAGRPVSAYETARAAPKWVAGTPRA